MFRKMKQSKNSLILPNQLNAEQNNAYRSK